MKESLKKGSIILLLFVLFFSIEGGASAPSMIGIIGGEDIGLGTGYFGRVFSDGRVEKFFDPSSQLPSSIDVAAINQAGTAIVGGARKRNAALIFPDGKVTRLIFPDLEGEIKIVAVAISPMGRAVIGGYESLDHWPNSRCFAGVVDPEGKITQFYGSGLPDFRNPAKILSVAIDACGNGLIGGYHDDSSYMYTAKIMQSGEVLALKSSLPRKTAGGIRTVAMNETGQGLIGGFFGESTHSRFYAARVDVEGNAVQVPASAFSSEKGQILASAMNASGRGMIGGYTNFLADNVLYAAFVNSDGTLTNLSPTLTQKGKILSVSLNNSGAGVIGGFLSGIQASAPYGSLVSSDGTLIPFKNFFPKEGGGEIHSVGMHHSGIAIIGGMKSRASPYAALVAPDGTVIPLNAGDLPAQGEIYSVAAIPPEAIVDPLIPKSFGLASACTDPLFSLSTVVLGQHLNSASFYAQEEEKVSLVSDGSQEMRWPFFKESSSALWVSPFVGYGRSCKRSPLNPMSYRSVGALLGFDFQRGDSGIIGAGVGFVFQNIHFRQSPDNARGRQEWITLYGTWEGSILEMEGALWGGLYQMDRERNSLGRIFSKSQIKGTLCSPHLKINLPFEIKQMVLRPFVQWDWANLWQGSIRERGDSGLNLRIRSQYMSLLRSEFGLCFSETIERPAGAWTFIEKVSYIHKTPFHAKKVKAHYVGSVSSFDLSLFNDQIQNFGGIFFGGSFLPKRGIIPLIGLSYEGEFGSKGLAQTLALELKKFF